MFVFGQCLYIEIPRTGTTTLEQYVRRDDRVMRHISLSEYINKYPECKKYYRYTIVRNPYERIASLYEHTKHFHGDKPECQSFDSFIKWFISEDNRALTKDDIRKTQFDLLNINGKIEMDYIGRFENYSNDVLKILYKYLTSVPQNKFLYKPYQGYYTAKLKDLITPHIQIDLETFNYKF